MFTLYNASEVDAWESYQWNKRRSLTLTLRELIEGAGKQWIGRKFPVLSWLLEDA